jgi:shikimate kinase
LKKNLTLTGMMGVGKSTIGKAVSKQLSMNFVDIDKIIEKKQKLTIQKIFEQNGESFFRKLEEKVTLEEMKKNNQVISLGGGAFMNSKIRNYVVSNTKCFWLNLNTEQLAKRLGSSKKRPLLINKNIKLTLKKIYDERKSTYSLANYKIDCNNLNTNLIVKQIVQLYEKN